MALTHKPKSGATLTGTEYEAADAHQGSLAQSVTHDSPDTDSATTSLHHTIGTTATTAAAGNHTHTAPVYKATTANGGTVVNPENASATAVPDLSTVSITFTGTRTLIVRYWAQIVKGTDGHKVKFIALRDSTGLPTFDNGWYSQSVGEGSRQQISATWIERSLAAGTYVITIKSSAAIGTSSTTYQLQSLEVTAVVED